jgi:hypothetical protein
VGVERRESKLRKAPVGSLDPEDAVTNSTGNLRAFV